ncbi:T9SS type B sorting domain-containing protein [Vicingus serpentipes]|uniref:T9SS type B sorting domain-containing protein n=1 Tax=Vicingus serpentipes TaxID=1926625 RepID=A0A5C6RUM0_9FLAO|nr:PKD domain-containing protein [Vicingus serpentipes]TXB66021.1 T9SS type B sorting domain-containing protein [Vicingus serpentipes]
MTKRILYLLIVFILCYNNVRGGDDGIRFIENKGQWENQVLFKANLGNGALFVEKDRFTFNLYNAEEYSKNHFSATQEFTPLKQHAYQVEFINAQSPAISSKSKFSEYYNFILGKDKNKWKSNITAYQIVKYNNLYKNINLNLYSSGNFLKYDFILNPNSNIEDIILNYKGVDELKIDNAGNLIVKTSVGDVIEQQPYSYQLIDGKKVEIKSKYVLKDNLVSFKVSGNYNKSLPLIIDPILIFASYSGSTADNFGMTATYGYDGSLFAGGTVFNNGYPTTLGAYDSSFNGSTGSGITDVCITRYDSTGTNLIYSTYIGGTATETVHSLIANEDNELYLYGATSSLDFPTTLNSYVDTFSGGTSVYYVSNGSNFTNGTDIYIAKLSANGSNLLGSTYLGGSQNDGVNSTANLSYDSLMNNYSDQYRGEIMLDQQGNCYLTSSTKSPDFPILNGFDNTLNGNQDAVIIKLNSDLSELKWSTYLGGDNKDAGYSIKVDTNNFVYVCGGTASNNFPTTLGTINTGYLGGKADGYITKIDTNGSQILSSTLLGTDNYDQCYFIEIDRHGSIYTVGQTRGVFPLVNATYINPNSSSFIVKLNNDLNTIYYSTVFGNGNINAKFCPSAFLVDRCENVYVSGWGGDILTGASLFNMPTTSNAVFPNSPNGFDFYLIVLERNLASQLYGTYFGGPTSREHVDGGTSRFDKNGIVYQSVCAGCGSNDDFPTYPNPGVWSNTNNSNNCNNGTFKFDFEIIPKAQFTVDNFEGCSPLTVTFNNTSNSSDSYLWDFGNGDTTSLVFNPIRTYNTPGTYTISLLIKDSICNTIDTAYQVITVNPPINITAITNDSTSCEPVLLNLSATGATSFIWSSNNQFTDTLNPSLSDTLTVYGGNTITYYVMATNGECSDIDSVTITYHIPSNSNFLLDNIQGCAPLTVNFTNTSGPNDFYLWDFGNGNTSSTVLNPSITYNTPGTYTVSLTITDSICGTTDVKSATITVASPVNLSIPNNPINTCDTALLFSNSTGATTYIWSTNPSFTDTLNTNLQTDSLIVIVSDTTTYYLLATNGICSNNSSITINHIGVIIDVPNGAVCSGQSDTLSVINLTSQPLTYNWQPISEIISGETTANPIVNPVITTTYFVTAQNALGCSMTDSSIVSVSGISVNDISITADKDTLYNGEGTFLHAIPDNNFTYVWNPSNTLNNNTIANPFATPTTETTYIALFTELVTGCQFYKTYTLYAWEINCADPDVFIPNAFTPNDDLENDVLYVRGRYVEEMELKIYDRWGELLFETTKQDVGWDGTYKGNKVDPAVYVYHLSVKCIDGQEYFKKGNVTVIR